MLSHPATATPGHAGYALIVLAFAVVTLGYAVSCWLWPFGACRRCKGTGKNRSPFTRKFFGLCRRCDGTGRALRIGRRFANHLRELRRNAR